MDDLKQETLCITCIYKDVCDSNRKSCMSKLESLSKLLKPEHIDANFTCTKFINAGKPISRRGFEQ